MIWQYGTSLVVGELKVEGELSCLPQSPPFLHVLPWLSSFYSFKLYIWFPFCSYWMALSIWEEFSHLSHSQTTGWQ